MWQLIRSRARRWLLPATLATAAFVAGYLFPHPAPPSRDPHSRPGDSVEKRRVQYMVLAGADDVCPGEIGSAVQSELTPLTEQAADELDAEQTRRKIQETIVSVSQTEVAVLVVPFLARGTASHLLSEYKSNVGRLRDNPPTLRALGATSPPATTKATLNNAAGCAKLGLRFTSSLKDRVSYAIAFGVPEERSGDLCEKVTVPYVCRLLEAK